MTYLLLVKEIFYAFALELPAHTRLRTVCLNQLVELIRYKNLSTYIIKILYAFLALVLDSNHHHQFITIVL